MSTAQTDQINGWTFKQYVVAAQWLRDNDVKHPINDNHHMLHAIQDCWSARVPDAPLVGPMQVYNPDVDVDLRSHVSIAWIHTKARFVTTDQPSPSTPAAWGNHKWTR